MTNTNSQINEDIIDLTDVVIVGAVNNAVGGVTGQTDNTVPPHVPSQDDIASQNTAGMNEASAAHSSQDISSDAVLDGMMEEFEQSQKVVAEELSENPSASIDSNDNLDLTQLDGLINSLDLDSDTDSPVDDDPFSDLDDSFNDILGEGSFSADFDAPEDISVEASAPSDADVNTFNLEDLDIVSEAQGLEDELDSIAADILDERPVAAANPVPENSGEVSAANDEMDVQSAPQDFSVESTDDFLSDLPDDLFTASPNEVSSVSPNALSSDLPDALPENLSNDLAPSIDADLPDDFSEDLSDIFNIPEPEADEPELKLDFKDANLAQALSYDENLSSILGEDSEPTTPIIPEALAEEEISEEVETIDNTMFAQSVDISEENEISSSTGSNELDADFTEFLENGPTDFAKDSAHTESAVSAEVNGNQAPTSSAVGTKNQDRIESLEHILDGFSTETSLRLDLLQSSINKLTQQFSSLESQVPASAVSEESDQTVIITKLEKRVSSLEARMMKLEEIFAEQKMLNDQLSSVLDTGAPSAANNDHLTTDVKTLRNDLDGVLERITSLESNMEKEVAIAAAKVLREEIIPLVSEM